MPENVSCEDVLKVNQAMYPDKEISVKEVDGACVVDFEKKIDCNEALNLNQEVFEKQNEGKVSDLSKPGVCLIKID
jgi:hypothetical protein